MRTYSGVEPYDPVRYEQAVQDRIKANARIGKQRRWLAEDESREGLIERLRQKAYDGRSRFLADMVDSYDNWGSLLPKQEAAVRRILDEDEARKAQAKIARAAEGAKSAWIGDCGERRVFEGEVVGLFYAEGEFGGYHVNRVKCGEDLIVYYGNRLADKGERVRFKATVKRHDEREGVKVTVVNRPKVEAIPEPVNDPALFERAAGRAIKL